MFFVGAKLIKTVIRKYVVGICKELVTHPRGPTIFIKDSQFQN